MSIHPSLSQPDKGKQHRGVLKRFERIKTLLENDKWKEGDSVFGLPKIKIIKVKIKKEKAQEEKPAEGQAPGGVAATPETSAAKPQMKKILISLIFMVLIQSKVFAQTNMPFLGEVTANNVNIRAGSNLNFEILHKLQSFDKVEVFDKQDDWFKIRLPKNTKCYINKKYVVKKNGTCIVDGNRVNLRARPSLQSNVLAQVNKLEELTIVSEVSDWFIVMPPENCFGWVKSDYIKFYSEMKKIEEPQQIKTAKKVDSAGSSYRVMAESNTAPVATGKLIDAGVTFNKLGRYKLLTPDKKVYYLKSQTCNLNEFIYYNVEVWGEIVKAKNTKSMVINVTHIQISKNNE